MAPIVSVIRHRFAPYVVLGLGLAFTTAAAFYVDRAARTRREFRFRNSVDQISALIEARIEVCVALLRGATALVGTSSFPDAATFRNHVAGLNLPANYPGIRGIGYIERVTRPSWVETEQEIRENIHPGFRIRPDYQQETAFPIVLLEPLDVDNSKSIGFDVYSDPVRREAILRAWKTSQPAASGKIMIVTEDSPIKQAGFVMYVPAFSGRGARSPEPIRDLTGFVYGSFRAKDFFGGILRNRSLAQIGLRVYDGSEVSESALLHEAIPSPEYFSPRAFHSVKTFDLAGRDWTIVFSAPNGPGPPDGPWLFIFGVTISGLTTVLMRNAERERTEAARRAAVLAASEQAARENEQMKQAILDAALDCIITVDGQGKILEFSAAAEKTFGYPRASAVGKSLADLIATPAWRDQYPQEIQKHLLRESKGLGEHVLLTALRADKTEFPAELAIRRIEVRGRPFFTAYLRDITERARAEAEIKELNNTLERRVQKRTIELEESNKQLESFSYSVSHDLRAPVRHIAGFTEILKEKLAGTADAESFRYLGLVANAAKRMGQLVDDLLAFSRSSRTELVKVRVSSNELVRQALQDLEAEIRGRQIAWTIQDLPDVTADPNLLRQVWTNLLSNAVKYTRNRERAEVSIRCCDHDGAVEFTVQDNGTGFDMNYAGKLFGVFQRLHGEEFEGTGIGLANVARIVQRHGGKIRAEGVLDSGAVFTFTLPKS
jgi:PAS domain S-box-containing protein